MIITPGLVTKAYKVLELLVDSPRYTERIWKVECVKCGKTREKTGDSIRNPKGVSCGCRFWKKGPANQNWRGYGELSGSYYTHLKHGAKVRGHEFDVTQQQLWELFLGQRRMCAMSGVPLFLASGMRQMRKQTASLDRIDSARGYVIDNMHWVHKDINLMKQKTSKETFLRWCQLVAECYRLDGNDCFCGGGGI